VRKARSTPLAVRWPLHLGLTATAAAAACLLDLGTKWAATTSSLDRVRFNDRPPGQLVPFLAVVIALLVATSLAGSVPLDLAAGLLAGGAIGNIASALVWREGIPDFIPAYGVLLNVGDLAMALGIAGLLTVSLTLARRELRLRRTPS
jgi:predicted ABC-type sugar transport system permease subunit